jgi:hypothetical protein
VIHIPIDLFFSYISIPAAIAVAVTLWGAWKLTEPEEEKRPESRDISGLNVAPHHKG